MRAYQDDVAPRQAVENVLAVARRRLGMEAAFLAELTETRQVYRATTEEAGSFSIHEGGSLPRVESYCQYVLDNDEPWVVRDTRENEQARELAITSAGDFGAYIGVPVRLADGRPFGTLCCLSHRARPDLGDRDVAVLEALADLLGFHVVQLEERAREVSALEERAAGLAGTLRRYELRLGRFAEIVHASETPTVILDPVHVTVEFCNVAAARLADVPRDAVVGRPLADLRPGWSEEGLQDRLAPVLDGGTPSMRYEEGAGDGWPALEVTVQRITGDDGDAVLLWTATDLTERQTVEQRLQQALQRERQAGEELRRLDALRNAFLSAVSHELRTPLTTIRGVAETIRERRATGPMATRLLDRLQTNAERLDRLLSDLLDLNQFSRSSGEVPRRAVRLDEIVRAAIDELDVPSDRLHCELEAIEAEVAPVKFERIVVNLVGNAAVHTPEGTPIRVRLAREGDDALLVVEDRGPGIDVAARAAVFEPFWQGPTAPAHQPGTGIGLSLVAAFAELHGGKAWVEEAASGGAAFHVLLPVTAPS